ncbi:hypothetical protein HMPREF9970_0392 [Lachnoanaerobaculum saburreum F0468]|uniref:Uncharacterized protein n=2 Tax=Lachnoanaerobaculum saburreum TaxID=467210 RepID=I0R7K5_9FIRM|nr:hypothetical protein HMPREF0381_2582 [Lachnoanaerobaculum saburreum DSM 3986]EIC95663.1 hypothetical protein HMPREF9970_0392 [Lachnoanaerobaculum saburreum F0468]
MKHFIVDIAYKEILQAHGFSLSMILKKQDCLKTFSIVIL